MLQKILEWFLPHCERCGSFHGLEYESSRTAYHHDPETGPDINNQSILLCRPCAVDHHFYWDEMWSNYYSGAL